MAVIGTLDKEENQADMWKQFRIAPSFNHQEQWHSVIAVVFNRSR